MQDVAEAAGVGVSASSSALSATRSAAHNSALRNVTPIDSGEKRRRRTAALDFERELNMRMARARQTMDFAAVQRARFSQLSIARMSFWEALDLLDELPPCALDAA